MMVRSIPGGCAGWRAGFVPALVLALVTAAHPLAAQQRAEIPAGTVLPIRFLHAVVGGRDRVGAPVLVQTLGALTRDSCVLAEPYAKILAHVAESRGGGRFGRPGMLALAFDSIALTDRHFVPLHALMDSLEYASPEDISRTGELEGGRRRTGARLVRAGAVIGAGALTEVGTVPVALLEGWHLLRRGPKAVVLPGEVASLQLTERLEIDAPGGCVSASTHPDLARLPSLPRFVPRTAAGHHGHKPGDPINLILLGTQADIDTAFTRAGWVRAQRPSLRSVARGVTAAVVERSAVGAPVSTQYFEGRKQDLTYELAGPNARVRHHIRLWLLDDTTATWVGATDQDVGLVFRPWRLTATHRIAPDVDVERDLVVRELEATSCADLLEYLTIPGAVGTALNASGQRFETDGRAAAIRVGSCR